jgi:hypothetical protein
MDDKKLSPIKRMALALLDKLKEQVITDCDESEVVSTMAKFSPENNGYFKQDDFVTADKAMKILHLGQNRSRFFQLTKEYGIENHKISNQNIGFLRKDIDRLAELIDDEVKEREFKENQKKKGQRKRLWS